MRRPRISVLNRLAAEDAMGIIEIIAAMVVFALVTLGIVPMILAGLKSTLVSKTETAAKNLTQERFEVMRNLPFYVGSFTANPVASCYNTPSRTDPRNGSGVLECDYKDLLDTYYRSTFPASSSAAGGFVANNAARSANEVSAGVAAPFYRLVLNPIPNFSDGSYSQVIATQFLTADRIVVTPASTYNTQDSDVDVPPSRLLGVTVITSWNAGANARKFSVYSQIAGGMNDPTSAVMQAQSTALRVTSAISPTVGLQAEAGLSRSDGTIYNGARASTFAQGAWAETRPGTRIDGRFQTASTPPESTPDASGTGAAATLSATVGSTSFTAARFAATDVSNVTAGVDTGQPSVPKTSPGTNFSTGSLLKTGASTDFQFTNGPAAALNALSLLDTSRPMVSAKITGSGTLAQGRTYVRSGAGTGHYAESGARATLAEVSLLPTTFASDGLVSIELVSSSVTCKTTGAATTGSVSSYDLRVKYFTALSGYITVPVSLVGGVLSGLLPDPSSIVVSLVPPLTLGNYVSSWTRLASGVLTTNTNASVSVSLGGVLQITTLPTRLGDATSAVKIDVGILNCIAEDRR